MLEALRAAVPVAVSSPSAARQLGYITPRSHLEGAVALKQNTTFESPSGRMSLGQGPTQKAQLNQDGEAEDLVIGGADPDYLMKQVQVVYSNEWRWNRLVRRGLDHIHSCCSPTAMLQGLATAVRPFGCDDLICIGPGISFTGSALLYPFRALIWVLPLPLIG